VPQMRPYWAGTLAGFARSETHPFRVLWPRMTNPGYLDEF